MSTQNAPGTADVADYPDHMVRAAIFEYSQRIDAIRRAPSGEPLPTVVGGLLFFDGRIYLAAQLFWGTGTKTPIPSATDTMYVYQSECEHLPTLVYPVVALSKADNRLINEWMAALEWHYSRFLRADIAEDLAAERDAAWALLSKFCPYGPQA